MILEFDILKYIIEMFRVLNFPPLPALGVTLIELMLGYRLTL